MRFEICAALTLLAGNLAIVDHPPPPAPAPIVVEPTTRPIVRRVENNPDEAAKLAALWLSHNAGFHPPVCEYDDPLAVLDADVDPSPGREHVIGNRRYGVAMYSDQGVLLGRMDPIGCEVSDITRDQTLSLGYRSHLTVTVPNARHGVQWTMGHIVERRDDKLVAVANLTLETSSDDWDVTGAISRRDDQLLVKYHGRSRSPGGAWEGVDIHCTLSRVEGTFVADDPTTPCAVPFGAR